MMTSNNETNRYQRGQSTVEFVVLSFVMVPLLLIVPLLGKYMDVAQTTAEASRYTAFEGTVRHSSSADGWKSDADLATEVRRRFLASIKWFENTLELAARRSQTMGLTLGMSLAANFHVFNQKGFI